MFNERVTSYNRVSDVLLTFANFANFRYTSGVRCPDTGRVAIYMNKFAKLANVRDTCLGKTIITGRVAIYMNKFAKLANVRDTCLGKTIITRYTIIGDAWYTSLYVDIHLGTKRF